MGELQCSGIGVPCLSPAEADLDSLRQNIADRNRVLVDTLKEDAQSKMLLEATRNDGKLGRMTKPVRLDASDLSTQLLHPRFGVEKIKADGVRDVRPIDNFSWAPYPKRGSRGKRRKLQKLASVNGHVVPRETLHHDHLDVLTLALREAWVRTGIVYGLFKIDIDSAFRRLPICPEHWWAASISFLAEGCTWVSTHRAMPFGATSAVHAWERIGALLTSIIVSLLGIVTFRYVDDFYGCEDASSLEHAVGCVVRVIRLLLGCEAVANHKVGFGPNLVILGVELRLHTWGFSCRPAAKKILAMLKVIKEAVATWQLASGCASKLAGRLQWSCQHLFHRVGRAMLRPLYDHIASGSAELAEYVRDALKWWLRVFELELAEEHTWEKSKEQPIHLFCDAASTPARLAAVAWIDGAVEFADCAPPAELVGLLETRFDNQIMGLELMSIVLALSTFTDVCKGRRVVVHSDNRGAEVATRSGRARAFDHCSLVHGVWTHALVAHMSLWVERVPSSFNIADSPSRRRYCLLNAIGARKRKAVFNEIYFSNESWNFVVDASVNGQRC